MYGIDLITILNIQNFSLTIWTALKMENVTFPGRPITTGDTGRMLGAGWLLYLGSLILNLVFYQMHPSSPEMGTWGAVEKVEEWTPLVEKETQNDDGEFEVQSL